ncbi:MAG: molybdopterin molybdotransferase MoeA [Rhodospirillaceae bacterium]|jgi:molybdopterin molybdotransferase|nr:molybdopterin molybdotransferase MoeA [Rhodospirillaceae bacterium]
MAQLSDDCFAFGGDLMSVAAAQDALRQRISAVVDTQTVALGAAGGKILAEDVTAPLNVPAHDNSAVDGYAVYFDDLDPTGETSLPVTGRVAAGHPLDRPAKPGEAIRIFTGAPVPVGESGPGGDIGPGPDTIMMQEDCREESGRVIIQPGIERGANRRFAGEDVRAGDVVLSAGCRLQPQTIGLAASVGRETLRVYKPLRVAVFSTGDEVREPGAALPPGAIYDSNRFTLMAALTHMGCQATDLGILPDRLDTIQAAIGEAAATHDLLLTSGGVSMGDEDHVKTAVDAQGSLDFWRLAIKPGRPVALGRIETPNGATPIAGLPGNPVAVMVTFLMIARPLILLLSGCPNIDPIRYRVRSGFEYAKKQGRREFVRARIVTDDGEPVAQKHGRGGAGVLSSLVGADGFVDLPEDTTHLDTGGMIDFLPFTEVLN